MEEKTYGWEGWKMPIVHLNDPDYCEFGCPICRSARRGDPFAGFFQTVESVLTEQKGQKKPSLVREGFF